MTLVLSHQLLLSGSSVMCIPSYAKYITLGISVGVLVILSVFYAGNLVPMVLAMILAIIQSRISCPKCGNPLLKDKNGW